MLRGKRLPWQRRILGDSAATSTEYALIAFLIAIVVLSAVVFLGGSVQGLFDETGSSLSVAMDT